jgi:voltage-gated potassium channel
LANSIIFSLLIASAVIVVTGSVVIFYVESPHPDSEINSMLDAVWWTVATVTTVGYGDIVPITETGKIIAIIYMFFGIGFLAIFLSVIGTRVYQRRFEKEDREFTNYQKLILQRIDDVEKIQEKIQKDLADLIEKQKEN